MGLNLIEINNEKILPIVIYGDNRSNQVTQWHENVMVHHFGLKMNYVKCPFPNVSHGQMMNHIINETIGSLKPDYYWFCDHDAIILKKECIDIMYDFVKNKQTIAGQFWQSNHKTGPNGMVPHPYISQAFLWFPTDLYKKLGRPDMDHWIPSSDTAEELTYQVKLNGYGVAGFYPSSSVIQNCDLDNGCKFGMGNIYGDKLMAHTSQQDNPESEKWFISMCSNTVENDK